MKKKIVRRPPVTRTFKIPYSLDEQVTGLVTVSNLNRKNPNDKTTRTEIMRYIIELGIETHFKEDRPLPPRKVESEY